MLLDRLIDPHHPLIDNQRGPGLVSIAVLLWGLLFAILYLVSRINYPLFHALADTFTVFIASGIFVVMWYSRHHIDNNYLLFSAIALLFFAFLDFLHMLGNKNMGVFPQYGNLGPALYIASRYILSISLLIAPLFINRKLKVVQVFFAYSLATLLILLSIFYWNHFPICYVEGVGLTTFKVVSDYIICLILMSALVLLVFNRRSFDLRVFRLLSISLILSIATGLSFTLYTDPFGLMNAIGHFFQILSFYMIYLAFIDTGLTKPQDVLFKRLNESEERLRLANRATNDVVWDWDIVNDTKRWNEAGTVVFGWTEIVERPVAVAWWVERLHRDDRQRVEAGLFAVVDDPARSRWRDEYRLLKADGTYAEVIDRGYVLRNEQGKAIRMIGAMINNTERKRAEEALSMSESRFRNAFEHSAIGMALVSPEGKFLKVNKRVCDIVGYAEEELMRKTFQEITHPEDLDSDLGSVRRMLAGEIETYQMEKRYFHNDGHIVWVLLAVSLVWDEHGAPLHFISQIEDITERKRSEEELAQSRALLEAVIDHTQYFIYAKDLDGRFILASQSLADFFGRARTQLLGKTSYDFLPKESADQHWAHDREVIARKKLLHVEETVATPHGPLTYLATKFPLFDGEGRLYAVCGVSIDITDRKRAEDTLRQERERLAGILRGTNTGTWEWNVQTGETVFNERWAEIIGCTLEEISPISIETWKKFCHPEDLKVSDELLESHFRGELDYYECEARMRHKSGEWIWILDRGSVVQWTQDGKPWVMMGTHQDITARKQAEKEMARARDTLGEAQKIAHLGSFEYIAATKKTVWSEEEFHIYGLDPASPSPDYDVMLQKFIHPDDRALLHAVFTKAMQQSTVYELEHRIVRSDGSVRWVFDVANPYFDDQGELDRYIGTTLDITDHKRAEEEKEELQSQLHQALKMESVGRLAGGVAHDFNNMLGVILGNVEMAMEQVDPAQPLHSTLQEIRKAAERSSDLTRQLLTFARKQAVSPKVIDMNMTIEGTLKMLRRLIGEDIHLAWLPGVNLLPVKIDPSQIDQILANLCVNARDAITGVGKVTISTENITLDESYCVDHIGFIPGEYVLLVLSDDGCGVGKETLSHLFEPFFTTKEVGKGTGLGLATVYGIVKQNNGFINVYSEPHQGTTFKIYLPRHLGKSEPVEAARPQAPLKRGHETILLAEDEPALLELGKVMLERLGYLVLTATTPGEAIRLAQGYKGEIHLLITDVVMPEMNGRELAKNLLALMPELKCLFASGYTADVIAHHGVLDEGVHFIQKPFSRQDLAEKVREVLEPKIDAAY